MHAAILATRSRHEVPQPLDHLVIYAIIKTWHALCKKLHRHFAYRRDR